MPSLFRTLFRVGAPVALAVACGSALGADDATTVWKCRDAHGTVTYTDTACAGGQRVDLRAGKADPVAIERLAQAQQAASERFARRQSMLDAEAAQRRALEALPPPPAPPSDAEYCEYCGGWVLGYTPPPPSPHPPRRPPARRSHAAVPVR